MDKKAYCVKPKQSITKEAYNIAHNAQLSELRKQIQAYCKSLPDVYAIINTVNNHAKPITKSKGRYSIAMIVDSRKS
jgi:hypothetical protein